MAHKAQLANVKYRNWVKAGLGIKYVKEGLEPFCDHLATQQHIDILNKVKQPHTLAAVSCGHCNVRTLQPNHVRTRNKQCPLHQRDCNCQYPGGKTLCPNNVCGAIYDEIIQLHASTPPSPYWKNTDARQWCTEPWSVAKCFINAPGYENKTKASEFDCPGLLHLLINNKGFQQHIKCAISGTDVFTKVRKSRNAIFHSHTMELENKEVNSYIDDMIELLEDEKELKHRQESKDAVINLRELKQTNFTISTADEDEILRTAKDAIGELQQIKNDSINEIQTTAAEGKRKLEGKGLAIKSEFEQKRKKIKTELIMKEAKLKETGENIKKELVVREGESKKKLEQKGIEIEKQLTRTTVEGEEKLQQKLRESTLQLESHKNMIQSSMTTTAETSKEIVTSKEKAEDEWESCLQSRNESQIKKLIQKDSIPKSTHLDAAYKIFEQSSDLLGDIFALVSEYIKKQSPHILRVYAAYNDSKNSDYCFLVFTRRSEARQIHLNEVYPIKIVYIEDCCEEDEEVVKEILKSHNPPLNMSQIEINLNKVISDHSERLMKETKNITLITTSMYKSRNYRRGKPPNLVNDPCVVILVMHKNWIPIGSKRLPREINDISVDVREGIAVKFGGKRPTEKHDNVRIGCKIESSDLPSSDNSPCICNEGTLGGFILGANSTIYGFTCAHILFPNETLSKMKRDEKIYVGKNLELHMTKKEEISNLDLIVERLEQRNVYQASCERNEYLGTVEMALYALGSTFDYTGVDFAVVKIDKKRIPNTTAFPYVDDLGTSKRGTEGASIENGSGFNSGKIIDEDLKYGEKVIKYGCKTLLTTGIFQGKRTFNNIDGEAWYGQCEIIADSSFAKASDSGSLVFRQKDRDLEAACILLGGTTVRYAATSFPDILERTGLKDITFLKFDSPKTKD